MDATHHQDRQLARQIALRFRRAGRSPLMNDLRVALMKYRVMQQQLAAREPGDTVSADRTE